MSDVDPHELGATAAARFESAFGRPPLGVAVAPGRVNLIGEHTDYNDGYVLPAAIDRFAVAAYAPNEAKEIRTHSLSYREERSIELAELSDSSTVRSRASGWFGYVAGVAAALVRRGVELEGADILLDGNLPIAAGLSSSAALELAVARAIVAMSRTEWDPLVAAKAAQAAESEVVGLASGIMDQMAAAVSERDAALLLDCRDLSWKHVPLPKEVHIVVMDTGTRRSLADSEYNERRTSCEEAVRILAASLGRDIRALRDATLADLERAREALGALRHRRARHVVEENERVLDAVDAIRVADFERFAELMATSHESLRNLYEVSSPALDAMVALANEHPACRGARMTGGGFGGAAVALVSADGAGPFVSEVEARYRRETGHPGKLFSCRAVSGARVLDLTR